MVLRLLGLIFGGIGAFALLIALFFTIGNLTFISGAATANGTVVNLRQGGRGTYYPVVQFSTADGRSIQFSAQVGSNPPDVQVGQTVKVYYNQANPADSAKADTFLSFWFETVLAGIFTGIFGGIGLVCLTIYYFIQRKIKWLQRQGQPDQALHYWREAIRTSPAESNYYLSLARLYEQTGQPEEALNLYLQLVEQLPSHKNYLVVAQRLAEAKLEQALQQAGTRRPIKIALLSNATLDQLQSYLRVACYRAGLQPEFYQGGFDQYTQEMLNPQSGLYRFAPEMLILAVHPSRLFPQLHAYPFSLTLEQRQAQIQSGLQTVQNLLDSFTRHSSALVLLHNMVVPQFPALGVYDWREELGQTAIFGEINHKLAELVRANYQNVYILDEEKVQARIGKGRATDPRLWFNAKMSWGEEALRELSQEYLRYLKPLKALSRKCIVLDLDNTLWGGVIGEDGLAGIQIGADPPGNAFAAFQRELEKLWQRGILLAISSKNNPEDVAVVFEQHNGMELKSLTVHKDCGTRLKFAKGGLLR
jgi:hypothetical protein